MSLFLAHVASTYIKFHAAHMGRVESRMRERIKHAREEAERRQVALSRATVSAAHAEASSAGSDAETATGESGTDKNAATTAGDGDGTGPPSPKRVMFSLRKKAAVTPTPGFETLPSFDEEAEESSKANGLFGSPESEFFEGSRGPTRRDMVIQNNLYGTSSSASSPPASPLSPSRRRRVTVKKSMKTILNSIKLSAKQKGTTGVHALDHMMDFDSSYGAGNGSGHGVSQSGTKPSFSVRMLVQERLAQIMATDIAGYHSGVTIKDNTLTVKIDTLKYTTEKWMIPHRARKAFRSVAFQSLFFVGEHDLIIEGADALLCLSPLEFHGLFSPLLAAMGDRETMENWLACTNVLADVELKRSTEMEDRDEKRLV